MKTEGYSIKDLETLSGVKAHTIRIWEKRYNLLEPKRTDTNIRFYDDEDLKRMLNVSLLSKHGFKISKIAAMSEEEMQRAVLGLSEDLSSESDYIDGFLLNMIRFDNRKFVGLANEVIAKFGFEKAVFDVFFKLFERIGTMWQVGSVFPAQEHYVTNIFRQKLIAAIDGLEPGTRKSSTILFFLPENELHEISLLFYSYLAQKHGYNVVYLGQFVPFDDLKKLNDNLDADYVFTAFVNSILKEDLEAYLVRLKNVFRKQKIFITGYQLQLHLPHLPRNVKVVKDYREFKRYLG